MQTIRTAIAGHNARQPRHLRVDAVLALRYGIGPDGLYIRCDLPFTLTAGCIDVPYDVWKDWRRLRLHVVPIGDVPSTVLLLSDLHRNPLVDAGRGPIHGLDHLDVDILPTRGGAGLSLMFAGLDRSTTISVFLRRPGAERHGPRRQGVPQPGCSVEQVPA